jgi:hypothetical protein
MNSVAEALNTLISGVNVAQNKGVYSLEEAHYIYTAISYLNSLQNQEASPAPAKAPVQEFMEAPSVTEAPKAHTDDSPQGY